MSDYENKRSRGREVLSNAWWTFWKLYRETKSLPEIWQKDNQEAKRALDTLDAKLETGTMSDERYKSRSKQHEAVLARTNQLLKTSNQDAELWLELAKETFSGVINIVKSLTKHGTMNSVNLWST